MLALFDLFLMHVDLRSKVAYATGWYVYTIRLPYLPPNFRFTRPILLILTGLISALLNTAVVVLLIRRRNPSTKSGHRKVRLFTTNECREVQISWTFR